MGWNQFSALIDLVKRQNRRRTSTTTKLKCTACRVFVVFTTRDSDGLFKYINHGRGFLNFTDPGNISLEFTDPGRILSKFSDPVKVSFPGSENIFCQILGSRKNFSQFPEFPGPLPPPLCMYSWKKIN